MQIEELTDGIKAVSSEVAKFDSIAAGIAALEKAHPTDVACDCTTTAGMKQAIAGRAAWRAPRIAVEAARKAAKAPVLELGRQIDTFARDLTQKLLAGENNYDDQIKAEEARREQEKAAKAEAERVRVQAHHDRIANDIRLAAARVAGGTSDAISRMLSDVEGLAIDDSFEEFKGLAQAAKDETVEKLRALLEQTIAAEKEAARVKAEQEAEAQRLKAEREELARLRAEQEKRDAVEREAQAEAARIERERLAAERATLEAEQAAARAEQKRLDEEAAAARRAADERAAAERAEADRVAAEARAAEQARLDAIAAEQRRKEQAEATARRDAEEQERARRAAALEAKEAAQRRLYGAAQQLLDALILAIPFVTDAGTLDACNAAIAEAMGEAVAS